MTEVSVRPHAPTLGELVLYRTETGGRLHLPACPHIGGAIREADSAERLVMSVCSWCQAEIDGLGRTYYESLDDAMRAFGCHVGTQPTIRQALRSVTHDQIWLPYSRSYIALGHEGRAVAWVGKTWVMPAHDILLRAARLSGLLPRGRQLAGTPGQALPDALPHDVGHRHLRVLRLIRRALQSQQSATTRGIHMQFHTALAAGTRPSPDSTARRSLRVRGSVA